MGCIPESSLAAPSLRRDGSIQGSYPGQWRCGEDDRSMMLSHRNAIWACAAHAIHTYTCESSCMRKTMSVTLPSTVWYTREGEKKITHLPSSYLTIYQLAYIHTHHEDLLFHLQSISCHLFPRHRFLHRSEALAYRYGWRDIYLLTTTIMNAFIHTYIHTYIQKEQYIPLHRVATPDEVRTDRDIQRRSLISIPSLNWQPSYIHTVSSHALQWAM